MKNDNAILFFVEGKLYGSKIANIGFMGGGITLPLCTRVDLVKQIILCIFVSENISKLKMLRVAHQKLHPQRRYAEFRFIGYIKCDLYVGSSKLKS